MFFKIFCLSCMFAAFSCATTGGAAKGGNAADSPAAGVSKGGDASSARDRLDKAARDIEDAKKYAQDPVSNADLRFKRTETTE